jgi:hypothetical protein
MDNIQQNTEKLRKRLRMAKTGNLLKQYKKFAQVLARPAKPMERIQTKIGDRNETEVRTAQPDDWVVSNVAAFGEKQLTPNVTFQKRYDVANPVGEEADGFKRYNPKNAYFYGVKYTGSPMTFAPPTWGGSTQNIESGYMIGGPSTETIETGFYGIDPIAFIKTYRLD